MRMQEPEQWQPSNQEFQVSQEDSDYGAGYSGRYEPNQQQQNIYPQVERRLHAATLGIVTIVLSSIGFFLTVAGIVGAALVLKYANGQDAVLAGGVLGLVSSIIVLIVCVAIFVLSVVALARPHLFRGWGTPIGRSSLRVKSSDRE
jgi:hypothetical protein